MPFACRRYSITEEWIDGRWQRVFQGRPKSVPALLDRTVARYGEEEGLVCGATRWTFRAFADFAARLGAHLQRRFGVEKGDRVAVLMKTGVEFAAAFFGAARIGAVTVPLNTKFKGPELAHEVNNSEASVLLVDREYWEVVARHRRELPTVRHVFVNGPDVPAGTLPFTDLFERSPLPAADVPLAEDDTVMIMYTSGTTGHPKGAMQHHRGVVQACMLIEEVFQPDHDTDRLLCALPMFHSAGIIMSCAASVLMGIPSVYLHAYSTKALLETLEREKITVMFLVPAVLSLLANHPELAAYDLSRFRCAAIGAAPKWPELYELVRRRLPQLKLCDGFGLTETHTMDIVQTDDEVAENLRSVGRVVPLEEAKVVDPDGNECPPGAPGELLIRGSKIVTGYWRNPEATREAIREGWLHTGDVASIDERGYVYILDRLKDMINRGGEKIFSLEVENVLCRHSSVLETAVVAAPHPVFGEEVRAWVVLKPGAACTGDELKAFCRDRLADYKVPGEVVFSSSPLPRNPAGKVLKSALRAPSPDQQLGST